MFVIYNTATTAIVKDHYYGKSYWNSAAAAKAAITRFVKKGICKREEVAFAEIGHYQKNIEAKVKRVNLMSGEEFYESVNTPYYCSPSSETYWSM